MMGESQCNPGANLFPGCGRFPNDQTLHWFR